MPRNQMANNQAFEESTSVCANNACDSTQDSARTRIPFSADSEATLDRIMELGRYRRYLRVRASDLVPRSQYKVEPSDIVQKTLLDAHRNIKQFRGRSEGEMAMWLSQMLANNVTDAVRAWHRQKRNVSREQSLEKKPSDSSGHAGDWLAAEQSTPSLCIQRQEQISAVSLAIKHLPDEQRRVIVLHHLQGKSLTEVANLMGKSSSAIAGLLYRGLKALRGKLSVDRTNLG